jgi:geranylgeranyl reductase family protein
MHDVLIIGGGPAGSSCAYWLADAGWDVAVVERKRFPRTKTCGDGLTPRAVRQLADMGLEDSIADAGHRYRGLRAQGFGRTIEMAWPSHPVFPDYGYTITRYDLDGLVADRAVKAGATMWQATEARRLVVADRGPAGPHQLPPLEGAEVVDRDSGEAREIRARYVVVADGANSRIGRSLGAARDRDQPLGMALRGYYTSDRHDDDFIESSLDIRDADGNVIPGYGWIFPLGDGRVNVGVGVLSSDPRWRGINTTKLMEAYVASAPASWGLTPETCLGPPTGGKLPMGLSVEPATGPNALLIGDAAGSINPFNGEGISYGYETGRMAAAALGEALSGGGAGALAAHGRRVHDAYGDYYRVGRTFVRLISNPSAMRACVALGMHVEPLMRTLLRIMANLLRPDDLGAAELGYLGLERLARVVTPDD